MHCLGWRGGFALELPRRKPSDEVYPFCLVASGGVEHTHAVQCGGSVFNLRHNDGLFFIWPITLLALFIYWAVRIVRYAWMREDR